MTEYLRVLEIAANITDLPDGQTTNQVPCPWCKRNKSFSVTKRGNGYVYVCHRASCHKAGWFRGSISDSGGTRAPVRRKFTPKLYPYSLARVEKEWDAFLVETYAFRPGLADRMGWRYSPETGRLAIPVKSPVGETRGYIARAFDGREPKTIPYRGVDAPWIGWCGDSNGGPVVVVEDLVSALKASSYFRAVALLGINLNEEKVFEIVEQSRDVVICLDRDASAAAYKYAKRYALFGNFRVVPLSKDIKDMSTDELLEWKERVSGEGLQTGVQDH